MALPTPTDHQWSSIKRASHWYKSTDWGGSAALFGSTMMTSFPDGFGAGFLGKGQDFFLGGYAGTGKSTVLPYCIEEFGLKFNEVAFVAPTGKAAKVMTSKLHQFGIWTAATTIHKLIYMPKGERADVIKVRIDQLQKHIEYIATNGVAGRAAFDPEFAAIVDLKAAKNRMTELSFDLHRAMDSDGPSFSLKSRDEFPEDVKLIVCDEGSMVGLDVAEDLASFGRPIFVMGDPGQLPPVGDTYGFNCTKPDAFLTEIHRQAADNPIIHLATMAREGRDLDFGDYGNGVRVIDRRNDNATLDMDREAMVLCGTHKTRWKLTSKNRKALGYYESGPCEGEPLLVTRNFKKNAAMVNGALFECMTEHGDLTPGNARLRLRVKDVENNGAEYDVEVTQGLFEEHRARKKNAYSASASDAFRANKECVHMDWGHVLTCHKSQGSQWDEVVVHDESAAFKDDRYRWLYTAITRAAERLTIVQ